MKKLYFMGVFALVSIMTIGCSNPNEIEEPNTNSPISVDTVPSRTLSIIKLPSEIQDLVFVTPIVDSIVLDTKAYNLTLYYDKGLVLYNPTQLGEDIAEFAKTYLNIVGTSPYIILDNGYAIVDWKWSYLQPLSGASRDALYPYRNVQFPNSDTLHSNTYIVPSYSVYSYPITNEQYYVLNIRWDELTDLSMVWDPQEGNLIETPELRFISLDDVKRYADSQDAYREPPYLESLYSMYKNNPAECATVIEEADKAQAFYVETLNRMIHNNDFEQWTHIRK